MIANAIKGALKHVGMDVLRRAYDRIVDQTVDWALFNRGGGKPTRRPPTQAERSVDAYRIAEEMYGPERLGARQRGKASMNAYVKDVLEAVTKNHVGGGGAFKKFLFGTIDLSPLFITREYENKYPELEGKYKRANTQDEARMIKDEMRKVRKKMLWAQPVTYHPKRVIRRDGKYISQSYLSIQLCREYVSPRRSRVQTGEGTKMEVTHLDYKGDSFEKAVFVPPISVRSTSGQKRSLRELIAETITSYRFDWGYDVSLEILIEEKEVPPERLDESDMEFGEPEMAMA